MGSRPQSLAAGGGEVDRAAVLSVNGLAIALVGTGCIAGAIGASRGPLIAVLGAETLPVAATVAFGLTYRVEPGLAAVHTLRPVLGRRVRPGTPCCRPLHHPDRGPDDTQPRYLQLLTRWTTRLAISG